MGGVALIWWWCFHSRPAVTELVIHCRCLGIDEKSIRRRKPPRFSIAVKIQCFLWFPSDADNLPTIRFFPIVVVGVVVDWWYCGRLNVEIFLANKHLPHHNNRQHCVPRPCQAFSLTGPVGCLVTVTVISIITIMGGKQTKEYTYTTGWVISYDCMLPGLVVACFTWWVRSCL